MSQEQEELRQLRAAVWALAAVMPSCARCTKPATHGVQEPVYCEAHATGAVYGFPPDAPVGLGAPLRVVLALLDRPPGDDR